MQKDGLVARDLSERGMTGRARGKSMIQRKRKKSFQEGRGRNERKRGPLATP